MKKYRVGYTQGVYDMFHVGHLNLLNNAKKYCDFLVVGINSDRLVEAYKKKLPIVNAEERRLIVENIKSVDKAIIVDTLDKRKIFKEVTYDAIFIGDDWKGNQRWIETQEQLAAIGVDVVYLPHTPNISSTMLRKYESDAVKE